MGVPSHHLLLVTFCQVPAVPWDLFTNLDQLKIQLLISNDAFSSVCNEITYQLTVLSLNISCTFNIRRTLTLGNSRLKFSPTISLAKTSNTRRTPSFDSCVSIYDKAWSRPTWSKLLRVPWDFDSPWITGPMTTHQSVAYVRHIILAPAANLCTLSAVVFLSIKAWIWRHLHRYIDGTPSFDLLTDEFSKRVSIIRCTLY